jgi:hypothetical protein
VIREGTTGEPREATAAVDDEDTGVEIQPVHIHLGVR